MKTVSEAVDAGSPPVAAPLRPIAVPAQRDTARNGGAPALDRVDIKPLDTAAALQILLAEVHDAIRDALSGAAESARAGGLAGADGLAGAGGLAGADDASGFAGWAGEVDGALPAARVLMLLVTRALPDTLDDGALDRAFSLVETALQAGVERAVGAVSAWRDTTPAMVQTVEEAAKLVLGALGDDLPRAEWLRAAGLELAPRLVRARRRRRAVRRALSDPDGAWLAKRDDTDECPH